ncbi:hypothetical protein [Anthocerotibacter panamensis]|uniref:hypothetical protein n=1 Tax=Anthocerotibacter panamensis TaxID=2857077 RepID=UPI001C40722F|nr:hypothetical protein [Anthocerotibacter panamensis]
MNPAQLPIQQINNVLKIFYVVELGIAAATELALETTGLSQVLAPVVTLQRLNATVQVVGWAALIAYLNRLEAST